jgi:hypothetical protein
MDTQKKYLDDLTEIAPGIYQWADGKGGVIVKTKQEIDAQAKLDVKFPHLGAYCWVDETKVKKAY